MTLEGWIAIGFGVLITAALWSAVVQGARADRLTKKINVNMLSALTRETKRNAWPDLPPMGKESRHE